MAEDAVKLEEENATLRGTAAANDAVHRRTEGIIKVLRNVLSESRKETEAALKERDAAVLENQNLKRKREGSTSPPPPQIKLLVRPHTADNLRSTSGTLSC